MDMSERDQMLIALVREVLGPRGGPREILPIEHDPRVEYITGVLEPTSASSTEERIEDNVDEVIEETSSEEDQDTQGYVAAPGVFSPALDPKALPRSIGLSFVLQSDDATPQIELCATWARYSQEPDGWHRTPGSFLSRRVDASQGAQDLPAGPGVRVYLRSREIQPGFRRVSVFLLNVTSVADASRPDTTEFVFQPQLRVHVCEPAALIPVHLFTDQANAAGESVSDAEDKSLALLYRDRTALARGHMCGAMWSAIDPERPFRGTEVRPAEAPFSWTDSDSVENGERSKFSPADVRTDLVPVYLVQTPDMGWQHKYGAEPELSPAALAEAWDPQEMKRGLQPLVDGYRSWIEEQQGQIHDLSATDQPVAQSHVQECIAAAERIQEAIDILATDDDARLAFCFANKAIHLQSRWKNPQQALSWRPFQLAFILLNVPPLANPLHRSRNVCDLLWFPTGGGKTEAYLGLAAFDLGLRRLRARQNDFGEERTGAGVAVLSRYTLRLLTIQQFRRALGVITACEVLRVTGAGQGNRAGWRPQTCTRSDNFIWGGVRFSAGLWVGGGVTPNSMASIGPLPIVGGMMMIAGALDILKGLKPGYTGPDTRLAGFAQTVRNNLTAEGEPAQVTQCPCCHALLAIPNEGLPPGKHTLHFVYSGGGITAPPVGALVPSQSSIVIDAASITSHPAPGYKTVSITFTIPERTRFTADHVDDWWERTVRNALGRSVVLSAARAARPGYFLLKYPTSRNSTVDCDFDIYCPNPACELNTSIWAEQVPVSRGRTGSQVTLTRQAVLGRPTGSPLNDPPTVLTDGLVWQDVPEPFRHHEGSRWSTRVPIPALTVDDQIYHRCPSIIIATVDKFARLAYEPKAASLFGNVTHYHSRWGYYRSWCPPGDGGQQAREHPAGHSTGNPLHRDVLAFSPPDLILQDELHLIEGPLGSLVGLYETTVDLLSQKLVGDVLVLPKYIASTATVRQATAQVQALFNRGLMQFPPSAISADGRFFATGKEAHPLDASQPGRLYAAVCAPGKGAQTPIVRIWSSLLQAAFDIMPADSPDTADPFWTMVGYFNATRELAGALSLYRQDIPERMEYLAGQGASRTLDDNHKLELSSRASSLNLPILLQKLELKYPESQDAVFATSMFGTGVDVDRLSLMVVHGQPKTTASYIQATGRVGRKTCGLVISFFRASRPRDLDHYEFFTGYHRALYRYVEPVTVAPFSPRARERCLGPLAVVLLRQAQMLNGTIPVHHDWRVQQRVGSTFLSYANHMATARFDPEVVILPVLFEQRARQQPPGRRPANDVTTTEMQSELDRWRAIAVRYPSPNEFVYNEPAVIKQPQRHVVLGDAQHHMRFDEAFENAPQSLRDVEETTGFKA